MDSTYKAVVSLPTDMTPEEIRQYAMDRARSLGYIVEDDTVCEVVRHTTATDGWEFLLATIVARIPRGVEAHPAGQNLGVLPTARLSSGKRFTGQGG